MHLPSDQLTVNNLNDVSSEDMANLATCVLQILCRLRDNTSEAIRAMLCARWGTEKLLRQAKRALSAVIMNCFVSY